MNGVAVTLPHNRKWLTIAMFAVIAPISLLTALKITGIIPGQPTIAETIVCDPLEWNMTRPTSNVVILQWVNNTYKDMQSAAYINFSILVAYYYENNPGFPAQGNDYIKLGMVFESKLSYGHFYSFTMKSSRTDEYSWLHLNLWDDVKKSGLEFSGFSSDATKYKEAYVSASAVNHPKSAFLSIVAYWIFADDAGSHKLEFTAETTIYNGTAYQKIVQPIELKMTPDIGQTFATAKNVVPGTYYGCLDITADFADMYSFNVSYGYVINITMIPAWDADYDLYLYDPNYNMVRKSTTRGNSTENIAYPANVTGTWYVNITNVYWSYHKQVGVYKLIINEPYSAPWITVLTKTVAGVDISDVRVMVGLAAGLLHRSTCLFCQAATILPLNHPLLGDTTTTPSNAGTTAKHPTQGMKIFKAT
jgi:hypothetical protein